MKIVTEKLKYADKFPKKAGKLAQRLHMKKDEIPFVRKYYIADKEDITVDQDERSVVSYISTTAIDRDGEQLLPDGVNLENYRKNPVVLYGHDYHSLPVAKNVWIKQDEKGLLAKTVFRKSQWADEVYRAYTEDVGGTGPAVSGWSVGFIPTKWETPKEKSEDGPDRIYTEWELLEYSAVPIPSCPEALTIAQEKGIISDRLQKDMDPYIEIEDEPEGVEQKDEDMDELNAVMEIDELAQELPAEDLSEELAEDEEKDITIDEDEPEEKDVEPGITKMLDTEGNASVWDIMDAIERNLDMGIWVSDLYPIDYPNGRAVLFMWEADKFFQAEYTYADGVATITSELTEVEMAYKPKSRLEALHKKPSFAESTITLKLDDEITGELHDLKEQVSTLTDTIKAAESLTVKAAVEPIEVENHTAEECEINFEPEEEKAPDIKAAISKAIKEAFSPESLKEMTDSAVALQLKKMRGVVE